MQCSGSLYAKCLWRVSTVTKKGVKSVNILYACRRSLVFTTEVCPTVKPYAVVAAYLCTYGNSLETHESGI